MSWYCHLFCKEIFFFVFFFSVKAYKHMHVKCTFILFFFPIWEKCEYVYCYENIHTDNITYTSNCIHLAATGVTDV